MRTKFKMLLLVLILCLFTFGSFDSATAQEQGPTDNTDATTQSTTSLPVPPIKWTARLQSLGYQTHAGNVIPAIVIRNDMIYVPGDSDLTALDVQTGKELWSFNPGIGLSLTQLEVTDDTVILAFEFTGDLIPTGGVPQAYVIGVDGLTGRERWSYATHESGISASSVAKDTAYIVGTSGSTYGLKVATGEMKWFMPSPNDDYIADIVSTDGILYMLGSRLDPGQNEVYSVYAVEAKSKQVRWSLEVPGVDDVGVGFPKLRLADTSIYVTGVHGLYALEEATGKIRWKYAPGTYKPCEPQPYPQIRTTPVVVSGAVYLGVALWEGTHADCYGSLASYILGLDAATGQEKWRSPTENDIDGGESLAAEDGILYYTSSAVCGYTYTLHSNLYAVDINSHTMIWQMNAGTENYFAQPLVIRNGTLFTGTVRTSTDQTYDVFYALTTAPVGMPKAGGATFCLWLIVLVGILSIVSGAILKLEKKPEPQLHHSAHALQRL